jgi:hypothetical protein
VPFCDDASYDPRQRPEYDIKYRQAVTSEDVFLQVKNTFFREIFFKNVTKF